MYVAIDAPVKFSVLKVRNASGRPRRLSATGYVEWVLGDLQAQDDDARRSPKSTRRAGRSSRATPTTPSSPTASRSSTSTIRRARVSGDRTEFLGRNGSLAQSRPRWRARACPARWARRSIRARALQVPFELADGEEREIVFRLGVGRNAADAASLVQRFRGAAAARAALDAVRAHWKRTLGAVQVETPDASLNVLANGWLALPDAGVPPVGAQRLLPVGRRLRLPRPAAGRDGARPRRARARCASTCCAARAGSSSKATSSTGGIRRRAAACARAARTTISGCRSPPRAT